MNAAPKFFVASLAACLLIASTGCKNKEATSAQSDAPVVNDGVVFNEGFSEQTIPGRLQASRPASDLHADCTGFITKEPAAEIRFGEDVPARIHVVSTTDTVLAIDGPGGIVCNDNFDGYNPSLAQVWEKGKYRIYVGSAEATDGTFEYDLNFDHYDPRSELQPTPIVADADVFSPKRADARAKAITRDDDADAPFNVTNDPRSGVLDVMSDTKHAQRQFTLPPMDRHALTLNDEHCAMTIDTNVADMLVNLEEKRELNLMVESDVNTGLMVWSPDGQLYCAREVFDHNPALRIENAPAGLYSIRIGVHEAHIDTVHGTLHAY